MWAWHQLNPAIGFTEWVQRMDMKPRGQGEPLKILACQIDIPQTRSAEDRDAHVEQLCQRLERELAELGVNLIVLPELSTIEYSREAFAKLDVLAEDLKGPSGEAFAGLAQRTGAAVLYGFARRTTGGYRISQALVRPDGSSAECFDKIHMAQFGASMEKEFFERGERLCVFELNGYRLAPMICYDIRVPEMARALALDHGVDAILHCGAYFRDESFASWHAFVTTRAMENQVYLLSLNRAGKDYGASVFCPPWVDATSPMTAMHEHDEAFQVFDICAETIADVRTRYSFLTDRLDGYRV